MRDSAGRGRRRAAGRISATVACLSALVSCGGTEPTPVGVVTGEDSTELQTSDVPSTGDDVTESSRSAGFCRAWREMLERPESDASIELLRAAPDPIAEPAALVVEADERGEQTPESGDALVDVLGWIELSCHPDVAMPGADPADERFAPPAAVSEAAGFHVCSVAGPTTWTSDDWPGVVLYGDTARDDPFRGEMLGVIWGTDGSAAGDGDRQPVTVRGTSGESAPFTVFQQVVIDDIGTVISWEEDGAFVGLYGRGFESGRTSELVGHADALVVESGEFRLPSAALPDGFEEVYRGSVAPLSLALPVDVAYRVTYRPMDSETALLNITGHTMSDAAFDAFRFLALPLEREMVGGREAWVGNAWGPTGPAVVTWREPDGMVVRLVGLQVGLDEVRALADATMRLERGEWETVVSSAVNCFL